MRFEFQRYSKAEISISAVFNRQHAAGDSRRYLAGLVSDVHRHAAAWNLGIDHAGVRGALPGIRYAPHALSGSADPQELEQVSHTSGAGSLQTFWRITLRLFFPAFMNGWLWVLVHAAKDFRWH